MPTLRIFSSPVSPGGTLAGTGGLKFPPQYLHHRDRVLLSPLSPPALLPAGFQESAGAGHGDGGAGACYAAAMSLSGVVVAAGAVVVVEARRS